MNFSISAIKENNCYIIFNKRSEDFPMVEVWKLHACPSAVKLPSLARDGAGSSVHTVGPSLCSPCGPDEDDDGRYLQNIYRVLDVT